MPKLARAHEGRQIPIRPNTSRPVPSASALLRRARQLELDAERLARRRRRPSAVDEQAAEVLGIMLRQLLHLLERAHREGRELDL